MNKKQKKKSYKKFKKQKEKVYSEMSSLDLDEFLSNIKKDFLNIIDCKNEESISEFNKIQSLLSFESSNIPIETVTNKLINVDDQSEGELNYDWLDNNEDDDEWEDSNADRGTQDKNNKKSKDKKTLKMNNITQPKNIVNKVTMSSVLEKVIETDLNLEHFSKLHDNLKLQNHC